MDLNAETITNVVAKVLVVDDRPENLFAMKQVLAPLPLDLVTAESGNQALAHILHHDFALALLDVQMPEMDGFELASLIRENEATRHLPIIFLTALNKEDRYVFEGYENGAVDYLFKPIDPEIVKSKVCVFCELFRQRKVLEREIEARRKAEAQNRALITELQEALDNIKTLRGILPICAHCKKIRDDHGYWQQVETYISQHSDAQFTHGLCRECMEKLYPNLLKQPDTKE